MTSRILSKFICFKTKYKGVEITVRKWVDENRNEVLLDDNLAKLSGYKSAKDFIAATFNTEAMHYKEDDKIWLEWNVTENTLKSVTISKKTH